MKRNKLEVLIAHLDEAGFELVEMEEELYKETDYTPARYYRTGRVRLLVAVKDEKR